LIFFKIFINYFTSFFGIIFTLMCHYDTQVERRGFDFQRFDSRNGIVGVRAAQRRAATAPLRGRRGLAPKSPVSGAERRECAQIKNIVVMLNCSNAVLRLTLFFRLIRIIYIGGMNGKI
jgi:hypothetical protein